MAEHPHTTYDEARPAPRKRRPWLIPLIAALVLVVAAGTGWYAFSALGERGDDRPGQASFTVNGNLQLSLGGFVNLDDI